MMYHIPDVLSTDQWRNLPGSWRRPSGSTGGLRWVARAAVKQNQQIDTRTPLYARLQATVLDMLRGHPQFFPPRCRGRFPRRCLTAMGGETYGFHVDGAVRQNGEAGWMRTDLSATLFLCDPESYEGGELVIEDTYGQHRVKLPAGHLVLYPASSLHCVTPVTRGVRRLFPVDPVDGPRR